MKLFAKLSPNNKLKILYTTAVVLTLAAAVCGILYGNINIDFSVILNDLLNKTESTQSRIFLYIRVPRTIAAATVGSALSVSGAVIQNVMNNKLASPSIIGVNSGAGLAVTICAAIGIYGGFKLCVFSFLGSFIAVMIISIGSKKWSASKSSVILMGLAINSILGAISDIIVTFKPDISVMRTDFKIGDFSSVTYQKLVPASIIIVITLIILNTLTNELDILTLGNDSASALGISTDKIVVLFLLLSAVLSGCAVSLAGLISFIGLIVPHIVRLFGIYTSKHLLPLCALFGSAFSIICDTLARNIFSPYEIPVGIIMSFIGGPFFLFILIRKKGGHSNA